MAPKNRGWVSDPYSRLERLKLKAHPGSAGGIWPARTAQDMLSKRDRDGAPGYFAAKGGPVGTKHAQSQARIVVLREDAQAQIDVRRENCRFEVLRLQAEQRAQQPALRDRGRQLAGLLARAQSMRDECSQQHGLREAERQQNVAAMRQTLEQARAEARARKADRRTYSIADIAQIRVNALHIQTPENLVPHLRGQEIAFQGEITQHVTYAKALFACNGAMQSTWRSRRSILWQDASPWSAFPGLAHPAGEFRAHIGEFAHVAALPQSGRTTTAAVLQTACVLAYGSTHPNYLPNQ